MHETFYAFNHIIQIYINRYEIPIVVNVIIVGLKMACGYYGLNEQMNGQTVNVLHFC